MLHVMNRTSRHTLNSVLSSLPLITKGSSAPQHTNIILHHLSVLLSHW